MDYTRHAKRTDSIMVSNDFNPIDHARPPREEGFKEETEQIAEILHERGDQRIGQLIINAIRSQMEDVERPEQPYDNIEDATDEEVEEFIKESKRATKRYQAKIENKLWGLEADQLLKLLQDYQEEARNNE